MPASLALFLETLGMHPAFQPATWTRPVDGAEEPPF